MKAAALSSSSATATSPSLAPATEQHQRLVLRVRQLKTFEQLEAIFPDVERVVHDTKVLQTAPAEGSTTAGSTTPTSRPRADEETADARRILARLLAVSVLVGAFARSLAGACLPTVSDARLSEVGALPRRPALVAVRAAALVDRLRTALVGLSGCQRWNSVLTQAHGPCMATSASVAADADATRLALIYGLCQLAECRAQLSEIPVRALRFYQGNLEWNPDAIAECVMELSRLAPPGQSVLEDLHQQRTQQQQQQGVAELESTAVVTPVRDPVTQRPVEIPARGLACAHLRCFDVKGFLQLAKQKSGIAASRVVEAPCPVCQKRLKIESLRVDFAALEALEKYRSSGGGGGDAECALRWDLQTRSCKVVTGKRARDSAASAGEADDEAVPEAEGDVAAEHAEAKRQRVEIGGHVLFMEE